MLRDVFYLNKKPNVHPRERFAESVDDARQKSTTEHFWIINEFCEYRNFDWDFDFEFLPDEDVWAEDHNNVWPSQHQKDSGTWLCPKESSDVIIYRSDVDPVMRKNEKTDRWIEIDKIDHTKFDFSWHPDITDPPYIYKWGSKFAPVQLKSCLEYHVENATLVKYMSNIVELLPEADRWIEHQPIDKSKFDMSWRPDPLDPILNYVWGNKFIDGRLKPTLEYHVSDRVDTKYMPDLISVLPEWDRWIEVQAVDKNKFDMSWRPDPREPAYIYVWGNKYIDAEISPTLEYHCEGATERKYMTNDVVVLPEWDKWVEVQAVDKNKFDMSWRPDPREPAYIYVWGNKYIDGVLYPTVEYHAPNSTERKYMTNDVAVLPEWDRWQISSNIDRTKFDFSWRPDPREPAYIYVWGNKYIDAEISPTVEYHAPNSTERKYMTNDVEVLPEWDRWIEHQPVDKNKFDFSWRPDPREPAYIYVWGNKYIDSKLQPTVEYHCEGATERKYMTNEVEVLPEWDRWAEVQAVDKNKFDMSWRPDPREPAYIYTWGNKYIDAEISPTVEYHCEGATERKYMTNDVEVLPEWDKWAEVQAVDKNKFDFSWRPDPREPAYIYVWGNKYIDGVLYPTVEYHAPNSTERKYMTNDVEILPEWDRWQISSNIDRTKFDFSWRPDPREPAYIYVWGNKYIDSKLQPTVEYHCEGATERKYMTNDVAVLPEWDRWVEVQAVDKNKFDMSWRPDPREPAYIYTWGNKYIDAEISPTLEYHCEGATERKYMTNDVAVLPEWDRWVEVQAVDKNKFDMSWRPDPREPAYIYVWGNKYIDSKLQPTVEYHCEGATERKYMTNDVAVLPEWDRWQISSNIDRTKFDFSWRPDPREPAFIYAFATVWNNRGGPIYIVPDATEYKYVEDVEAKLLPSKDNWEINDIDVSTFDFSWVPHPDAPPYIYQFGTLEDANYGPRYVSPNNNGVVVKLNWISKEYAEQEVVVLRYYIETTLDDLVREHPNELFWAMHKNIDYSTFDFSWRPEIVETAYQLDYVHVFGSPESELTQTYFVSGKNYLSGKTSFNFIEGNTRLDEKTLFRIFNKPDMFYIDKGNSESQARFDALKLLHPKIQKTRYLNSWVDTIKRCANRATSELIWVLNSELDYTDFDFEYYPNPWQLKMVNVFGTQWSHWGSTFLVNRETFAEDTKYINIIEHLSNLNFVKTIRARATECIYDTIIIDHGNKELDSVVQQVIAKTSGKNVTVVRYNDSYLQTLKDIVTSLPEKKEHYLWLCSSVCDYASFDFSYMCDPFARDNLHVFASGKQKFGDTFLVDVNKTKEIIDNISLLENYTKVNYNGVLKVNRLPEPIIITDNDTLVDAAMNIEDFPYATIITSDNKNLDVVEAEPMNLWAPETKNILVTSTGATRITVPYEAKEHVNKELYDYPYIKKAPKLAVSTPMDIVYLSNGETGAEENWEHLQEITKGIKNRVVRVDGVNGRVQAYHAALEASETPWAFTVFAKLKINPKFDWSWQPDRMQIAKHYIFYAKNPVNGLIYGHQGLICYNKKLTLANSGKGLDFTLDDEHEVVPLLSGVANYNTDEFSTWRTAFREVLKLKAEDSDIARTRLDAWLNNAEGKFSHYSINGAIDATEYYDEVGGDFDALKLSYEWAWLKERFDKSKI